MSWEEKNLGMLCNRERPFFRALPAKWRSGERSLVLLKKEPFAPVATPRLPCRADVKVRGSRDRFPAWPGTRSGANDGFLGAGSAMAATLSLSALPFNPKAGGRAVCNYAKGSEFHTRPTEQIKRPLLTRRKVSRTWQFLALGENGPGNDRRAGPRAAHLSLRVDRNNCSKAVAATGKNRGATRLQRPVPSFLLGLSACSSGWQCGSPVLQVGDPAASSALCSAKIFPSGKLDDDGHAAWATFRL